MSCVSVVARAFRLQQQQHPATSVLKVAVNLKGLRPQDLIFRYFVRTNDHNHKAHLKGVQGFATAFEICS